MIILVDIDHVLADAAHRDPLIGGEGGWDAYHSAGEHDRPLADIAGIINALHNFGYTIVGLTGRTEKWRQLTLGWMTRHGIAMDELIMRPDRDFRPVGEMKLHRARERFGDDLANVHAILDDNENVCAAFRAANITVLQVTARRMK